MTVPPFDDHAAAELGATREEVLRCGRPLPPLEESAIDDLTDVEWQAFWDTITAL